MCNSLHDSRLTVGFVQLLVLLLVSCGSALAQTDPTSAIVQPREQSKSRIKGHVIVQDSGLPARAALVRLIDPRQPRSFGGMITDERGNFSFIGIPAGDYYVMAQAAEELDSGVQFSLPLRIGDAAFDAARLEEFTRGFPKITIDGTNSVQLELRISGRVGGMISGRVTSSEATPVADALVNILHQTDRGWRLVQSVRTSKDGAYRVTRLPAGDYLVRAVAFDKTETIAEDTEQVPGAIYFASASEARDAVPVTVLPDQETSSINISLRELRLATVSGTLKMARDGRPLAGVMVRLSGEGSSDHLMNSDEQGRWSFAHVAAGRYHLVIGTQNPPLRPNEVRPRFVPRHEELTVGADDVKDVVVELSEGGQISGAVSLAAETPRPTAIAVSAKTNLTTDQYAVIARVNNDGTFTLSGVPVGEIMLHVTILPLNSFVVKSIELNEVNLLKEKLVVTEGSEVRNVRIVIASGPLAAKPATQTPP